MNILSVDEIINVLGMLLIIVCAVRGYKRGFVTTIRKIVASILAIMFVYLLNTWAMESLLATLVTDYMIVVVRIILCVATYIILFLLFKAIFTSLQILSKLPIVRGLNKLLGLLAGAVYGVILIGIIWWAFSCFFRIF